MKFIVYHFLVSAFLFSLFFTLTFRFQFTPQPVWPSYQSNPAFNVFTPLWNLPFILSACLFFFFCGGESFCLPAYYLHINLPLVFFFSAFPSRTIQTYINLSRSFNFLHGLGDLYSSVLHICIFFFSCCLFIRLTTFLFIFVPSFLPASNWQSHSRIIFPAILSFS